MIQTAQRYLQKHRLLAIFTVLILALLTTGFTATLMVQASTHPQRIQQCGKVQARLNGVLDAAHAKQAENCFWQTFQQCHPATLTFTIVGVDTMRTHTFTIHNENGNCPISDTVQLGGPDAVPAPSRTYTCTDLVQTPDGLYFSACDQDGTIFVPAPPA